MLIAARLLDEDHLIDTGVAHRPQVATGVVRCPDATRVLVTECGRIGDLRLDRSRPAAALELTPEVGASRRLVVGDQRIERVPEELETFLAAPDRLGLILVQREPGDEGDVGVDGVADRDTLLALDDVVVDVDPGVGLLRVDETEGEREALRCLSDHVQTRQGRLYW